MASSAYYSKKPSSAQWSKHKSKSVTVQNTLFAHKILFVTFNRNISKFETLKKFLKLIMSDDIPFDVQSEIMKRLPVKSLVQCRSVSKQWKSFIDNPEFIKTYHINHPNPQHHLLLQYTLDYAQTYTSIIDDNSFPQQKFPLTAPEPLNLLTKAFTLGSVDGVICFYGFYKHTGTKSGYRIVVLWNPFIRKSVGIRIPNVTKSDYCIGVGVCSHTNDLKLVKINFVKTPSIRWEVQVFTLTSRVWKTVYTGAPFKSCLFMWGHVCIDGIIYWLSCCRSFMISFDLKSEKFGEVCLPERLVTPLLVKVNGSLGLLEYYKENGMSVCGVWMRKDGMNQPFTRIYTVSVEGKLVPSSVLGFRNNGEVVIEKVDDDFIDSQIEICEPSSGRLNSVGISGECHTFTAWSYMETLLLLDQSNSIIH